ncbi:hypothetical protein Salat_2136800 [Sesamum alatum]|uniref:Secondary thiamine-phosphate synthase enzyme n=1 Tax=Sesamum alatum TaxID=300844 RepID=A0AAE2CH33_9LAMI|nr:hypothetical protein Salat_2136800 [Sesamum alatum]
MQAAVVSVKVSPPSSSSSLLVSSPAAKLVPIISRTRFLAIHNSGRVKSQYQHRQLSVDNRRVDMAATASPSVGVAPKWAQKTITIPAQRRGCHLITSKILKEIGQDLSGFKCGLAHLFLQHTSASLTVNENYDSDVRDDTETFLNKVVPEGRSAPWKHTLEGPDDMPAHIKSSMFGCSLTLPITDGKLNMGTWQGIWLCEHRDAATPRKIVITLNGI